MTPAIVLSVFAALVVAWWWWRRGLHARRIRGGFKAESTAEKTLAAAGYAVVERQPTARYRLTLDGQRHEAALRGDLLVERAGQRFLAEVKAPVKSLDDAGVRRQLLEYGVAFGVRKVLLVDKKGKRIREVQLPRRGRKLTCLGWGLGGVMLGALWAEPIREGLRPLWTAVSSLVFS